jgi:protease secretion system membrane fusion protein
MNPASDEIEDQISRAKHLARWALGIGVGLSLIWAAVVPLAEGVPTEAQVSIETKRRVIQHLSGGIVREVLVGEGQLVKSGDPLLKMDEASTRANLEVAKQSLAGLQENLVAQQAVAKGLQAAQANRESQIAISEAELDSIRRLVAEGYAPKVQQFQLERSLSELRTSLTDTQTNLRRTQQAMLEIRHQMKAAEQRLIAAQEESGRLEIRSPADGQVVGLQVQSGGAVVQAGQRLMDIVPSDERLILEARVPPQFINRIEVGQPVDARFSAFAHSPQLVVEAKLVSISQDVLTDQEGGAPFYLARAEITPQGVAQLGKRSLQPGMSAEVIIQTGSRTLLNYVISPLTRRLAASMKEE